MPNTGCGTGDCACKSKPEGQEPAQKRLSQVSLRSNPDSDDIWGSDDDGEGARDGDGEDEGKGEGAGERDWERNGGDSRDLAALRRRQENKGYLDGLIKGKEAGLQTGFDQGYPLGAQLGALVGDLVAKAMHYGRKDLIDEQTKTQILTDLKIERVLDAKYFDDNLDMKSALDHPIIIRWTTYLNQISAGR